MSANVELSYDSRNEQQLRGLLGPTIEVLLADPDVTEIFIRPHGIWIERLSTGFVALPATARTIKLEPLLRAFASLTAQNLSLASPRIQISLKLGTQGERLRFTALYAGPGGVDSILTIRIPRIKRIDLQEAVITYGLKQEWSRTLLESLTMPQGLLVAGGVGSGKTTFLRSVTQHVIDQNDGRDNIVIVEDTAELSLDEQPFVTAMESSQWLSFGDLCRDALRHRPTRLVVGEVRGGEAIDAVRVGGTGAALYMTLHCNSAHGAVRTLLSRMAQGQKETERIDPSSVTDALRWVIVLGRQRGNFKVREFCHIQSIEHNNIQLQEIVA
ncbi:MAG: ATPase, T2SS/T4P/T4SS family [Vulcanimicrobiaceae bacterium]